MGAKSVYFATDTAGKIKKWKVKEGMLVSARQVIFLYDVIGSTTSQQQLKFKCPDVGTVLKRIAKEGDIIRPGDILLELEECSHPTVMKDMCAECGADLRKDEQISVKASVPMVHSVPELKVSEEQAQIIGKADETRLLRDQKLVLLVDLDQTLIHTTNDNIPPNIKDVYHFQLYGPQSHWYHTRIRPRTQEFLEEISKFYELHICTFGARNYAHTIAMFLDPLGKFFSHRILSRDECFDANSKTANLKALFPCGDNMVCIIDDREDVWNFAPNLIHVKPYHFFKHTGDINAPPGLMKNENDDVTGFDFSKIGNKEENKMEEKDDEKDKKVTSPVVSKSFANELGESTTDKDTEDEREGKVNPTKDSTESAVKNFELEQVTGDLQLSEEDSEDGKSEQRAKSVKQDKEVEKSQNKECDAEVSENIKVNSEEGINMDDEKIKKEKIENLSSESKDSSVKEENLESEKVKSESSKVDEERSKEVEVEMKENTNEPPQEVEEQEEIEKDEVVNEKKNCVGKSNNAELQNNENAEAENNRSNPEGQNSVNAETERQSDTHEPNKPRNSEDENLVDVEDGDDYLLYLEDILKNIHKAYYEKHKNIKEKDNIPDLKKVIPEVKSEILKGCNLIFSGLVPSHIPLEKSRAYLVALSLGATVSQEISSTSTHLVAARPGTAKVNSARRHKGLHTVTPLWLWGCAERWERLDERLFPLGRSSIANRHPPAHCGSPQHEMVETYSPAVRERTQSGRFIDTINPLLTFSSEDMQIMDQEVADLFKEDDEETDSDDEKKKEEKILVKCSPGRKLEETTESSSSQDSLSGEYQPKGWEEDSRKSKKRKMETTTCTESEIEEESPSVKFRRGEPLPSDLDLGEESQDSPPSDEPIDDIDDGDWSMMGAALEREFLSGE